MDLNTIFNQNGLIFNNFFNKSLTLPFNFDQIKIQSNDISNYRVFNQSISKLYINYLYLYGWTQLASNVIPVTSNGIVGNYNNTFNWNYNLSSTQFQSFSSLGIGDLDKSDIIYPLYYNNTNLLITCSTSAVNIINSPTNNSTINIIFSTYQTDYNSTLYFKDITSIVAVANNLYVLDGQNNSIFLYNIESLLYNNSAYYLSKTLGGLGLAQDNTKFNNPISICTDGNQIYVLDQGNLSIKVYDLNLNWVATYILNADFKNSIPVYITYNQNIIYVVDDQNKLSLYSGSYLTKTAEYSLHLNGSETFKNIFFAKSNKDILYIVTTQNIYKRFITDLNVSIGKFLLYNFNITSSENLLWADSISYDQINDYVYILSNNNTSTKILQFVDNENFISILTEPTFDVYPLSSINVVDNEYNQEFCYNKSLIPLMLNHLQLK